MTQGVILGCQGNTGNHLFNTEATAVINSPKIKENKHMQHILNMSNCPKIKPGTYIFLQKYATTFIFHLMPTWLKIEKNLFCFKEAHRLPVTAGRQVALLMQQSGALRKKSEI